MLDVHHDEWGIRSYCDADDLVFLPILFLTSYVAVVAGPLIRIALRASFEWLVAKITRLFSARVTAVDVSG